MSKMSGSYVRRVRHAKFVPGLWVAFREGDLKGRLGVVTKVGTTYLEVAYAILTSSGGIKGSTTKKGVNPLGVDILSPGSSRLTSPRNRDSYEHLRKACASYLKQTDAASGRKEIVMKGVKCEICGYTAPKSIIAHLRHKHGINTAAEYRATIKKPNAPVLSDEGAKQIRENRWGETSNDTLPAVSAASSVMATPSASSVSGKGKGRDIKCVTYEFSPEERIALKEHGVVNGAGFFRHLLHTALDIQPRKTLARLLEESGLDEKTFKTAVKRALGKTIVRMNCSVTDAEENAILTVAKIL